MKLSFKYSIPIYIGLMTSLISWLIVELFLDKLPVYYIVKPNFTTYFNIQLNHFFFNTTTPLVQPKATQLLKLSSLKLKAIYKNDDGGFIIVQDKNKTVFIDVGQTYKGYKLIQLTSNSAIFKKNGKVYTVEFPKPKKEYTFTNQNNYISKISKKTLHNYMKNFSKIWNNIAITKDKKGYRITFVRPNSIFDKIGLKKGDILVQVNGVHLKNDQDAWNIYKKIDTFEYVDITLIRNNKEKVLTYELD